MTYNSPEIVHGGCCENCERHVRDNEADLYPWGRLMVCFDCLETLEAEADDEARQERLHADRVDDDMERDREGWFNFAASVALAPFNGRA